jgi:hypothetical protein
MLLGGGSNPEAGECGAELVDGPHLISVLPRSPIAREA